MSFSLFKSNTQCRILLPNEKFKEALNTSVTPA